MDMAKNQAVEEFVSLLTPKCMSRLNGGFTPLTKWESIIARWAPAFMRGKTLRAKIDGNRAVWAKIKATPFNIRMGGR